jgi:type IV secretory pathway ATPase VirB11/archaellum biosynthesis ATPase
VPADLVERTLRTSGCRIDMSTPFVDAMMPDGSRLHVVIPDITRRHMAVNSARSCAPATATVVEHPDGTGRVPSTLSSDSIKLPCVTELRG